MGFKNSPQILQRIMNKIFGDKKGKGIEVYIDDICDTCAIRKAACRIGERNFKEVRGKQHDSKSREDSVEET